MCRYLCFYIPLNVNNWILYYNNYFKTSLTPMTPVLATRHSQIKSKDNIDFIYSMITLYKNIKSRL